MTLAGPGEQRATWCWICPTPGMDPGEIEREGEGEGGHIHVLLLSLVSTGLSLST